MHWLLIGYMWLFVHRPFEEWPILGAMRLELFYVLGMTLVWAVSARKQVTGNSLHLTLAAFALAVFLCAVASAYSDSCWLVVENYLKLLVFYLLVVTAVHDEKTLRLLLWGLLGAVAVFVLHSLLEFANGRYVYRMGIRRMVGIGSAAMNPNAFAAGLVLVVPFIPVLWRTSARRGRCFLGGLTALIVLCVLLTGSRGGLLLLLIAAGWCLWTSPWRKYLLPAALAAAPVVFLALPDQLQGRFETIVNADAGPKNAQTSADARMEGLTLGLALWQAHPLTGVGPGAWRPATGRLLESHNLYGQLVGEMGTLGLVTFASLLLAYVANLLYIRRWYRARPEQEHDLIYHLGGALTICLVLLLVQGVFGHSLFRYNWVWCAAFAVLARQCLNQRTLETGETWNSGEDSTGWDGTPGDAWMEERETAVAAWHGRGF